MWVFHLGLTVKLSPGTATVRAAPRAAAAAPEGLRGDDGGGGGVQVRRAAGAHPKLGLHGARFCRII